MQAMSQNAETRVLQKAARENLEELVGILAAENPVETTLGCAAFGQIKQETAYHRLMNIWCVVQAKAGCSLQTSQKEFSSNQWGTYKNLLGRATDPGAYEVFLKSVFLSFVETAVELLRQHVPDGAACNSGVGSSFSLYS